MADEADLGVVELKPEVVFLYEILQELTRGQVQIPRFQRAFVWRPDQMTELLDSINKQYPIGSLLVWETDEEIATLDRLGPFLPSTRRRTSVGYLLDGHQRLLTLAGALLPSSDTLTREAGVENGKWEMFWNVRRARFQHRSAADARELLFPMTSLLDTMNFFESVELIRNEMGDDARRHINEISALARTFQSYRVPVIRIKQTGLSEAVEIFARLNSKGQSMTADQMVSALTFRQVDEGITFDLAFEIDKMVESLGERQFGDIDRATILRAILANIDENIYKTDWTKLAKDRREDLQVRLQDAVARTDISLGLALDFLDGLGVTTSRLLPYGLQLVLLSAFFDRQNLPSTEQSAVLARWFWVSSFSAWFGGANPSRIGALIREFREDLVGDMTASELTNFDLEAEALPFPLNFDMRSARTRTLLLVMLSSEPSEAGVPFTRYATEQLAAKGPSAVGHVYWSPPRDARGNPANRLFRAPSAPSGALANWIVDRVNDGDQDALESSAVDATAAKAVVDDEAMTFVRQRQARLIELETEFQSARGVTPSRLVAADAPVDTD
jgi:Protein of unknown function DUF262